MKLTKFFSLLLACAALVVGCDNGDTPGEDKPTGNITLTADADSVDLGTPITFTVMCEGVDVTSASKIYLRAGEFPEVSNPYTPESDGVYEFYAVYGASVSSRISVTVLPVVPALPKDAEPANTSFNHRILLVDHTGVQCSYCPQMMQALKDVSETGDYHSKYYEAMSHTYNTSDPAWSKAADAVTANYPTGGSYPSLTYNFRHTHVSKQDATDIMQQIDALWSADGAAAGIAASSCVASSSVIVNVEVKAAEAADYRITAWLLEDAIEAAQGGAKEDWMNIHNNAIRQIVASDDISGVALGAIEAGATASAVLDLPILSQKWNRDNFKVMLIVSKPNSAGRYDVANVAICPANGTLTYDYK
ncbi:MAG: Omp28-related outer membrane protein [Alistipes sp.]|nr:Omp28-related outer membrane protein [Alistipes sp.]